MEQFSSALFYLETRKKDSCLILLPPCDGLVSAYTCMQLD